MHEKKVSPGKKCHFGKEEDLGGAAGVMEGKEWPRSTPRQGRSKLGQVGILGEGKTDGQIGAGELVVPHLPAAGANLTPP